MSGPVIVGWDFSTGSVKGVAFDEAGTALAEVRLPTDLWTADGVSELSILQLEGQVRAAMRGMTAKLKQLGRVRDWAVSGISATHHTAGRVDAYGNQVRRMICWNDQTLAQYHAQGLERLGGPSRVNDLIGGPWAVRYSLSHLVKDEATLSPADWERTKHILLHGPLVAGYMTGRFDVTGVSSAASTGIMDFRTEQWNFDMLGCLASVEYRKLAEAGLPTILPMTEAIGPTSEAAALDAGLPPGVRPKVYPTLDDQAAGLVGGGATDDGHVAIILGNSAVVNSSSNRVPTSARLDVMKLNWGPYLWMRCYSNGAQFLDNLLGKTPDWAALESAGAKVAPGCAGVRVLPFLLTEPSLGVHQPRLEWLPSEPTAPGVRYRAALESLAYLIGLGVRQHEADGQKITRITVSGGIAKSRLMCEILASVLGHPLEQLVSSEGPALGAAVTAYAGWKGVSVAEAVRKMVAFREPVQPRAEWQDAYRAGLDAFAATIGG